MTTPYQIHINFDGDSRGAQAAAKALGTELNKLNQKVANSAKANQGLFTTQKSLATQEVLLANAWKQGSHVIDRRYLSSVRGLREGLYRLRQEAQRTLIVHRGMIKTLSDPSMANAVRHLERNFTFRTLDNMSTKVINLGKNAQWTGRQLMVGVTAPILALGAFSLKSALGVMDIERELKRVFEGTDEQFKSLNKHATELSELWGVNVEEIKKLQVAFAQTGFGERKIKDLSAATQEFATIGDVATESAQLLVQTLALQGIEGEALRNTLAKLDVISDETSVSMEELADGLPRVANLFKSYGGSIEQAAAMLVAFKDNAIPVSEGANALKSSLQRVGPALAELTGLTGLSVNRLGQLKETIAEVSRVTGIDLDLLDDQGNIRNTIDSFVQIAGAYRELQKTTQGQLASRSFVAELFGQRQGERGVALLNQISNSLDESGVSATGFARALAIANAEGDDLNAVLAKYERQSLVTQNDPALKLKRTWQELRNAAIEFGKTDVLPVAQKILDVLASVIDKIEGLSPNIQKFIGALLIGAAVLGPLIYIAGQFMIGIGALAKGMIAPFKAWYGTNQRVIESFEGASDAAQKLHGIAAEFAETGDQAKFVTSAQKVVDSMRGQTVTAQDAANAQKNLRSEILATGDAMMDMHQIIAKSALTSSPLMASRLLPTKNFDKVKGPDGKKVDSPDMIAARDAVRSRLVGERHSELLGRDSLTRHIQVIEDEQQDQANEMYVALQELEDRMAGMDAKDLKAIAQSMTADSMPNKSEIREPFEQAKRNIEALRSRIQSFESKWGVPLPISPNASIEDDGLRFDDFFKRLTFFEEGLDSQLRQIQSTMHANELSTYFGPAKPDVPLIPLDEVAKSVASVPDELYQVMREAIYGSQELMKLEQGKQLLKMFGLDPAKVDQAADNLINYAAGISGGDDFASVINSIAHGGVGTLPARGGAAAQDNTAVRLAAGDLSRAAKSAQSKHGGAQLLTGRMMRELMNNLRFGPDQEKSRAMEDALWQQIEAALHAEDTAAHIQGLKDGSINAESKEAVLKFVKATQKSVASDSFRLTGGRKTSANAMVRNVKGKFEKQYAQTTELAEVLRSYAEQGDEEAKAHSSVLEKALVELQTSAAMLEEQVRNGFEPEKKYMDQFKKAFGRIERIKRNIREKGAYDDKTLLGLLRKKGFTNDFEFAGLDASSQMQSRVTAGRDAWQDTFNQDYEAAFERVAQEAMGQPVTEAEVAEIKKARKKLEKQRKKGLNGAELSPKDHELLDIAAKELVLIRRIQDLEIPEDELNQIRKKAAEAAEKAVQDLNSGRSVRLGGKRMPSLKSELAQRRTTAIDRALKAVGLHPETTTVAGEQIVSEIYSIIDNPKLDEILDAPSKEMLYGKTARQQEQVRAEFKNLRKRAIEANQEAMRKEHESWIKELIKMSTDSTGNLDQARLVRNAQERGIPKPIKDALVASVFGGMEMGSLGGSGRTREGALGYAGVLKQQFGNDYGFQNEALLLVNTLAEDLVSNQTLGDAGDIKRFRDLAKTIMRRSAESNPDLYVGAINSIGVPLKKGTQEELDLDRSMILENTRNKMVNLNKDLKSLRSKLLALYKERKGLQRGFEATEASILQSLGSLEDQKFSAAKSAGMSEGQATEIVRDLKNKKAVLNAMLLELEIVTDNVNFIDREEKIFAGWMNDDPAKMQTSSRQMEIKNMINRLTSKFDIQLTDLQQEQSLEKQLEIVFKRVEDFKAQLSKEGKSIKRRLRGAGLQSGHMTMAPMNDVLTQAQSELAEIRRKLDGDSEGYRNGLNSLMAEWQKILDKRNKISAELNGTFKTVMDKDGKEELKLDEAGLLLKLQAEEAKGEDADKRVLARLRRMIENRHSKIAQADSEIEAVRAKIDDLRRKMYSGKSAPAAALIEFAKLDDLHLEQTSHLASISEHTEKNIDELTIAINGVKGRIEAITVKRENLENLQMSLVKLIHSKTGAIGDDMQALDSVIGPVGRGPKGKFAKPALENIIGGLSPEMSKSMYEILVRQIEGTVKGVDQGPLIDSAINRLKALDVKTESGYKELLKVAGEVLGIDTTTLAAQKGLQGNPEKLRNTIIAQFRENAEAMEENIEKAVEVIRAYNPDMSEDLVREFARKGILLGRVVRQDLTKAEAIFGKHFIDQMQEFSRGQGMFAAGMPGMLNTMDRLYDGEALVANARDRDVIFNSEILGDPDDDVNEDSRKSQGGSARESREHNQALDLITGFKRGEIENKQQGLIDLDNAMTTLDRKIAQLEKQERDAIRKNGHARSQETKRHLQTLQAQRAQMAQERQEAINSLQKLKTTKFAVVGDDGHTEIFDDYDQYVAIRREQAESLVAAAMSDTELDAIAKEEYAAMVKAMEADLERQKRADAKIAKIQAKQAAERVEANMRDAQSTGGKIKRLLLGKAAKTGIGPADSAILAVMHANDVAAGKAMQMYTQSEIANFREFQRKAAAMSTWIASMTGAEAPMPLPAGDTTAAMAAMSGGQFVPVPQMSRKDRKAQKKQDKQQRRAGRGRGFGTHMMVDAAMDAVLWGNMGAGIDGATENLTGFKGQLAKVSGIMRDNPMFIGLFPMMTGQITQVIEATSKWKFALLPLIAAIGIIAANWKDIGPQLKGTLDDLTQIGKDLLDTLLMPFEELLGMSRDVADAGHTTSASWVNMGKTINSVLRMVVVPLQAITAVIKATMPFWIGLATAIKTAVNAFTALPTPIQNTFIAFMALWGAVRFGLFAKLAGEATKLGAALKKLKAVLIALTTDWKKTAASARTFASSLSAVKVAGSAAVIGLMLVINALGKYAQASRDGERAAQEFIDTVAEQEQLGKHQTFDDTADSYARYAEQYNSMLDDYERAKEIASGSNAEELWQNLKNPIGTIFGDGGEITKAEKETKRLAGELNRLLGEMGVTETQFNNMKGFFEGVRKEFSLTEAQARRFLATTEGDHIDIRIDPDESLKQFREAWSEAGDEINGEVLTPEVDTTKIDEATSKVNDFISTFRDQMRSVVDGWKDAAMDAFDDWADSQVEAIDAKIEALDKQAKAEEQHQQDMDYLQRKEDMRNKRRSAGIKHTADRDLAIYEGRYDDAKQLDYEYEQTLEDLKKEEENLEEDRARTLGDRRREAARERLDIEKEELRESLDKRRENLQAQLDAMTEFIPKNVAEAQRMHESIAAKMSEFTLGYGKIGEDQAAKWGAGWATAMSKAKDVIADEAHWAGEEAMKAFAVALGVNPDDLKQPGGSSAPNSASSGPTKVQYPGQSDGLNPDGTPMKRHSGGTIGNTSMAPADVPATLQTGEYVVRRSAVAKLGTGYLDKINQGVAPENVYHAGGPVEGIAKKALSNKFKQAKDNFMNNGGAIGGFTADQVKQAYQSAMGGYGGGGFSGGSIDTAGKSIDYIVDNLVKGTHPGFKARVAAWNREMGNKFNIEAGYRSMASQRRLYNRWLARVPGQALAAPPGRSMHNFGLAIDLSPSRTTAAQRAAGAKYGLRWPMSFEPWHVEPVEARAWRDQILNGHMPAGEGGVPNTSGLTLNSDFAARLAAASGGGGGIPGGEVTGGKEGLKAAVRGMMPQWGWGDGQWPALDRLVSGESSWSPTAKNPTSTAAGLFQFLKSTWKSYITDKGGPPYWSKDPMIQTRGGFDYIKSRYGDPASAWKFWNSNNPHWYHGGGVVGGSPRFPMPKFHDGNYEIKRTGVAEVAKGERIRYADQEAGGGDFNLNLHFDGGYFGSDRELEKLVSTIEKRVMPRIQRARGQQKKGFTSVTR